MGASLGLGLGLAWQGNEIQLGRGRSSGGRRRSPLSLAPCSQGPRFLICVG